MVSDFITERDGFLCHTEAEHNKAKETNPDIPMGARTLLEYGESRDGYRTADADEKCGQNCLSKISQGGWLPSFLGV